MDLCSMRDRAPINWFVHWTSKMDELAPIGAVER
jgi:hypothetical protein